MTGLFSSPNLGGGNTGTSTVCGAPTTGSTLDPVGVAPGTQMATSVTSTTGNGAQTGLSEQLSRTGYGV